MAIYHCSIKVIGRGSGKSLARGGRSAVGAAAYRSGTFLVNEYDGMVHDYTKKKGVLYSEILLPENAPSSFSDRSTMWNSLELYEKRGNAQLAREIEASLPVELGFEEHKQIIHDYLKPFVKSGMVADFSIHSPDHENPNPHVHIMLTMRPMDEQGRWMDKSKLEYELDEEGNRIKLPNGKWKTRKVFLTDWDDRGNCTKWRKEWADAVNLHLEKNGLDIRIDHRSYEDQGIDQIPTIHLGTAATAMERRGIQTERGNINRRIKQINEILKQLREKIADFTDFIEALGQALKDVIAGDKAKSPELERLLYQFIQMEMKRVEKYSPKFQIKYSSEQMIEIQNSLKELHADGIYTLEDLEKKVSDLKSRKDTNFQKVKQADKRLKELAELIDSGTNYIKYISFQKEAKSIRWNSKREKYEESHRMELTLWGAASRYLHGKKVEISSLSDSMKTWKKEKHDLEKIHETCYGEFHEERDSLEKLEKVYKQVQKVITPQEQTQTKTKNKTVER